MTASESASRYGSGIIYSMAGPLVVGGGVYAGAFDIDVGWEPTGGLSGVIEGSANGQSLSGPCTPATPPTGAVYSVPCAVDLDGSTANLTFQITMVETSSSQTGPSDYTYTYAGSYSAS